MKRHTAQQLRDWRTRSKPLRRRNHKRANAKRAQHFGPQAELCKRMQCCVPGCSLRGTPHHEPPISKGGTDEDTVPLCFVHHIGWRHAMTRQAFERKFGVDLGDVVIQMRRLAA